MQAGATGDNAEKRAQALKDAGADLLLRMRMGYAAEPLMRMP